MMVAGKPFDMEAMEDLDEGDTTLGVGKVEDFTWKGLLDFTTCTECGRCQSQCPAWNTDKPLSPKLLVMTLRDHAHAKAPWLMAAEEKRKDRPAHTQKLAEAPLGDRSGYDGGHPDPLTAYDPHGPDASSTRTCCGRAPPVAPASSSARSTSSTSTTIIDMRRYQNLIESPSPASSGRLFKNLEKQGQPVGHGRAGPDGLGQGPALRRPGRRADVEDCSTVDYLFWVGCAGAYEDRAKKTTARRRRAARHGRGDVAVLGDGETCTGDSARRAGNEMLFQMLAMQNVEMLNEVGATKIVVTCAHCFNTLKNEYPQVGGNYEVVHHTQLLNRLVREKRSCRCRGLAESAGSSGKDAASTAELGDLPRPVLPRPAQRRLRPAARAARCAARRRR
jgi:Fe-S oxidoreductase